jgi:hypothetical protein
MSSPCTSTLHADFGSHASQLGLLRLRRRLLLRRCLLGRLRSRLLTTSAHDSPTNNGQDNDDDGCNNHHLISRHVFTSLLSSLDGQSAKEKGWREAGLATASDK